MRAINKTKHVMISNFQLGHPLTWKSLYKTSIILLTLEKVVEKKWGIEWVFKLSYRNQ